MSYIQTTENSDIVVLNDLSKIQPLGAHSCLNPQLALTPKAVSSRKQVNFCRDTSDTLFLALSI